MNVAGAQPPQLQCDRALGSFTALLQDALDS